MRLTRVALAAICIVAVGLRVGEAAAGGEQPPDAVAYAQLAVSLSEEGRYAFDPADPSAPPQPASTYSPGLPLLVAGIYEVGGEDRTLALIVLALIGAIAVPLAFILGRRLGGDGAGLLAALVVAVLPALTEYAGLLMTEPLAATLLIAALLASLRASDDGGRRWALTAGLLLGALTLVRAEFIALVALLPLLILLRRPTRERIRRAALPSGLVLLAAILVIAPWTIRNASALDRFVPVSTGGGKTLYIGTNLEADGDAVNLREDLLAERPRLAARLRRLGPPDDPANYALERALLQVAREEDPGADPDEVLGSLGREQLGDALTERPGELLGLLASKTYDTWTKPARETMDLLPWRILQFALVIGALAGLVVLALRRRFEALVLGATLLFIAAVGALLIASPRRAVTAEPLLCALASTAAASLAAALRGTLREHSARP